MRPYQRMGGRVSTSTERDPISKNYKLNVIRDLSSADTRV